MIKSSSVSHAAVFLTATLLIACQPVTPAATQPPTPTPTDRPTETEQPAGLGVYENVDPSGQEIVFWHQHTGNRQEALDQIVAEFNESNPWDITVAAENQGHYGEIFDKMLEILNTPDAPDLVVAYQNQAATYQLSNGLVDINPLINSGKWGLSNDDEKDFFVSFWSQDIFPIFDYSRLGFPPNRSMEVLYYNIDWLKEMGYDGPPQSAKEFKEMACKASQTPFSGAGNSESIGYALSIDASRFASWVFAFGGDIFDYTANQYTYNSEAAQQAAHFLQELFAEGCAVQVPERDDDIIDFGAGKLLFAVDSSTSLPDITESAAFNWDIAPLPNTKARPAMNIYGASISIPKTTPEEELSAWLFLKYFTEPDVQATWAKASNYFPVRISVAYNLEDYFQANPAYKTAFDLLPYGKFEPPMPGYDFVRDEVEKAMEAIANGEEIENTLTILNQDANALLKEQTETNQ